MKIGIICEGENTDAPVIRLILEHHFQEQIRNNRVQFQIKGVDKGAIFSAGDVLLKEMFDSGATRALIVWDLLPPGHQMGVSSQYSEKPNREEQRRVLLETICTSPHLQAHVSEYAVKLWHGYGFDGHTEPLFPNQTEYFRLVCICFMLETWLITDPGLLRELASTNSHTAPEFPRQYLDECRNPIGYLRTHFGRGHTRLRFYNKLQHNEVVARAYIEKDKLHRMRECDSFCRVIDTIEGWLGK